MISANRSRKFWLLSAACIGCFVWLAYGILQAADAWLINAPGGEEAAALFGSLAIGPAGYIGMLVVIVLMVRAQMVEACGVHEECRQPEDAEDGAGGGGA